MQNLNKFKFFISTQSTIYSQDNPIKYLISKKNIDTFLLFNNSSHILLLRYFRVNTQHMSHL